MSSASIKKIISCNKKNLIQMVLDIEQYPQFVPWCLDGKINKKNETVDFIEIEADLKVGKKFIYETYSSLVLYSKKKNLISVTNLEGPLKYLKNEWKFKELNNKTELDFSIDFELKNNFLNMIMKNYFNFGLNKITDAFEKRAIKIFK
ncbi:type II toxin-antitoxin system RatA family toxin [Pelagibacteraceae bacterium]|nr:type II toxin-antitoxin system RatA family toxin [Pelagibacteraceae bacterium]MDC0426841.1 type II toxin-antitoxin system RatA family toxin [Pelagibacteraceae bacterium]